MIKVDFKYIGQQAELIAARAESDRTKHLARLLLQLAKAYEERDLLYPHGEIWEGTYLDIKLAYS